MTTVIMTSPGMPGEISFVYNEINRLVSLKLPIEPSALTDSAYRVLFAHMPYTYDMMPAFRMVASKSTFIEQTVRITFDMFWDRYDDKDRSSKKKTQAMWQKMPYTEQVKAFYFIRTYNKNRGTAEKKYAETYLRAELWNN